MAYIPGGNGNDSITGTMGSDYVMAYSGNDTVNAGDGHDTIYGGDGNDSLTGGNGYDIIFGDAGDDRLFGGNDTYSDLYGGAGNDSIYAGDAEEDWTWGGDGQDLVFMGAGSDLGYGGGGQDTLYGGAGHDSLYGDDGHDLVYGEAGNDTLGAGAGDDTVYGGEGQDSLTGEAGHDSLSGDAGDDRIYGGDGNDTLQGGLGADLLTGGAGNDRFQFTEAGGGDVIADFNLALAAGHTADQLDVSDLSKPDGSAVHYWDVVVTDDGQGNAVLTFPMGEAVVLKGIAPAVVKGNGMLAAMGIPCFASGTRLDTPDGPRPVESIAVGDFVCTARGPAPVLWHGARALNATALADAPQHRPILIAKGAIGNARALILSPQHGVCVPGVAGMVRARHLAEMGQGARVAAGLRAVRYHHLLLPHHALIAAQGAWVESFYPGAMAIAALPVADRMALIRAVVRLRAGVGRGSLTDLYGPRVVPLLSRQMAILRLRQRSNRDGLRVAEGIT